MTIESQETPSKSRRSIKKFVTEVCKESSVEVISAVASTSSLPRRIFRVLIFSIFTAAFLYQCVMFLGYILGHPTVVNIEILNPEYYLTPAFTFCNYNQIKRSKFCNVFPEKCMPASKVHCSEFPHNCRQNTTWIPTEECLEDCQEHFIAFDLGHDLKDLFIFSKSTDLEDPTGPYFLKMDEESDSLSNCYSLNARYDSHLEPQYTQVEHRWKRPLFSFEFNPEENETFNPSARAGILFSIHSPFITVNPFRDGILFKPGYQYRITIRVEEEVLLPYPYRTDCLNYTETWIQSGKSGARSQEMCQELCLLRLTQKYFNCTDPHIRYSPSAKLCNKEILEQYLGEEVEQQAREELKGCLKKCKEDCYKVKYTHEVQETFIIPELKESTTQSAKPHNIKVKIYLEDSEVISLQYQPQYQEVEMFSYIGGFIGIWLGVSLVQIADVFESLFRITRYFFKKSASMCKWRT